MIAHETPACLWHENHYGLVSLWDMLQIYAHRLVEIADSITELERVIAFWQDDQTPMEGLYAQQLRSVFGAVQNSVDAFGLVSTRKQLREIVRRSQLHQVVSAAEMAGMLRELRRRITEDMEDRVFFAVDPTRIDLLFMRDGDGEFTGELIPRSPIELFGEQVCTRFASSLVDIEEARNCLIVGRHTACVFHLMRVLEVALRAMGISLNDPNLDPKRNPSWESILRKCDSQTALSFDKQCAEWQRDPGFFAEATATLRAVKNAWRNSTMHVERTYDGERALEVWVSVRAFVRHIASHLSEAGTYVP